MKQTPRRIPRWSVLCLFVLAPALGARQDAPPPTATAEDPAAALAIASVRVTPEKPAAETLCRLEVTLDNQSGKPVSALAFEVTLDGTPLPVYERQLFVETIAPGKTTVRLFNFWTSEPDRPPPSDGTIDVRVTLAEARWLTRDVAESGDEILTLGEPVQGLPTSASTSLTLAR